MAILHMETDDADRCGRMILHSATDMLDRVESLRYTTRLLEGAWESPSSDQLITEMDRLLARIQQHVHQLDEISNRTIREVDQWLRTDEVNASFTDYFGNISLSLDDAKYLFAGGYLATHLRWSPLRPNSMVFTGPNWMRKLVGIKEATRVIKPTTLVKQMALLAYAENVVEGIGAAKDTFYDPEYFGTTRAVPAAVVDGVAKTLILAAGTTALVAATALITTISAPAVVVGGLVIGTWVVGGFFLDKFVQTPAWQAWQESSLRDQAIEKGTRLVNSAKNIVEFQVQSGVQQVKQAFGSFFGRLLPSGG